MTFFFKFFSKLSIGFIYCLLLFLGITIHSHLFAYYDEDDEDEEEITFFHNGMDCCECFLHCSCFGQCVGEHSVCFPDDKSRHPRDSIDKAWHEFMRGILTAKKVGPFFTIDWSPLQKLVGYREDQNTHSISDYLEIIEKFRKLIITVKKVLI